MSNKKVILSRGKNQQSVLNQLLTAWNFDYATFAKELGVDRDTLWQYRAGKRKLKLETEQIQKLESLLDLIGLRFRDLPPDWFRDTHQSTEKN